MLSKISVDEVFMHYFDKMLSASGASPLDRTPTGDLPLDPGDFRPSEPLIAHPWKKIL